MTDVKTFLIATMGDGSSWPPGDQIKAGMLGNSMHSTGPTTEKGSAQKADVNTPGHRLITEQSPDACQDPRTAVEDETVSLHAAGARAGLVPPDTPTLALRVF